MLIRKILINNFQEALKLSANIGVSPQVYTSLSKKGIFYSLLIEDIDNRAASILKQEALSCGAELAVNIEISAFKKGKSKAVLFATYRHIEVLSQKLLAQPFGLKETAENLKEIIKELPRPKILKYKNKTINLESPAVMGIINLDPNSFSNDAVLDAGQAAEKASYFESAGVKIIDLGAESSKPGIKPIDAKTEIKRLLPALKKIRKKTSLPISIDTYKYETARAAIDEGADIINDIFALREGGGKKASLLAGAKCGLILMHSQGIPENMQKNPHYKDCLSEIYSFLYERKKFAESYGIEEDFISVDPGIGFGKTAAHNAELIKNLKVFSTLGAITIGVSRKRFIEKLTGHSGIAYWIAANLLAALKGADIIRVHDVEETVNVLKLIA